MIRHRWHEAPRNIAGVDVPPDVRVVTYVSRGFESMRGFDIFMRSAKLIEQRYPNVIFIIVGISAVYQLIPLTRMVGGGVEGRA